MRKNCANSLLSAAHAQPKRHNTLATAAPMPPETPMTLAALTFKYNGNVINSRQ